MMQGLEPRILFFNLLAANFGVGDLKVYLASWQSVADARGGPVLMLGKSTGVLRVYGTSGGDHFSISTRFLRRHHLNPTLVRSVEVNGIDGDDSIAVLLDIPATLNGNDGDDRLLGGSRSDSLVGGQGNNFVDGGARADTITGDIGNDTLKGGTGSDVIRGFDGDDV